MIFKEDDNEIPYKSLIDLLKSSNQRENMIIETTKEARDPHSFKIIDFCVIVGFTGLEGEGQFLDIVIRIKEELSQYYVMREGNAKLYYKGN